MLAQRKKRLGVQRRPDSRPDAPNATTSLDLQEPTMISEDRYVTEDVYTPQAVNRQEDIHEPIGRGRATSATAPFPSLASALLHEQLRQMRSLAGQPGATLPQRQRRQCGRWLIVQRLRRGITAAMLADRVGVDADLLQLLELGLADRLTFDDERQARLAPQLADADRDADLVMAIMRGAIGDADVCAAVLDRVADDLRVD